MTPTKIQRPAAAFTLIELLVTIVIIVVLASLSFMMMSKIRKRAEAANQISILRQTASLLVAYSSENNGYLPAPQGRSTDQNGKKVTVHWHQALHGLLHSDLSLDKVKGYEFWENNDPLIKNPLYKKPSPNGLKIQPWCPGFGMNWAWVNNLKVPVAYDKGDWQGNAPLRLSLVKRPSRLPIIAPAPDYHFQKIKDNDENLEQFLINGKLSVLFIDGHVEDLYPAEYEERELDKQPRSR